MLFGLAEENHAPRLFARLSRAAVPAHGLLFSCFCLLLGALLVYVVPNLMTAFTLVTTLSAVLFMFVWSLILLAYIAYRRKRPQLNAASSYKMPGGVFMCWICLAFFAFVLWLLTLRADTREALLASPVWFLLLAIGYVWKGRRRAPASSVLREEG
jgi:D-serine/D-alanine/glycine transporter